jgi:hypothetical protein
MDYNKVTKLITTAIEQGFTVVVDDNYNFGESLQDGTFESHDDLGGNHKFYKTPELCIYACLQLIQGFDNEYEILT